MLFDQIMQNLLQCGKMFKGAWIMTNRQRLTKQLIEMSDEEFARKLNGRGWFCDICPIYDCNDFNDCEKEFIKWLQKEEINEI